MVARKARLRTLAEWARNCGGSVAYDGDGDVLVVTVGRREAELAWYEGEGWSLFVSEDCRVTLDETYPGDSDSDALWDALERSLDKFAEEE